jgi:AraC family transcriptional activator of pobA
MASSVPVFYLYGEPRRAVDERFVHVEALIDRTRPSEWTIRPHVHPELNHIFYVAAGGGAMRADAATLRLSAPGLVLVPAGTVHGFAWDRDSAGLVLTVANDHLRSFLQRDPDLAAVFAEPAFLACSADNRAAARIAALRQELGWAAPGHRAAAESSLLDILVTLLRLKGPQAAPARAPTPHAALVARLRERIDSRFHLREPVEVHAAALGVSPRRLRAACAGVARESPTAMLDHRAMLEARRSLLYGDLTVAEIGYALGFGDPAYFSRFFTRHAGLSPAAFRKGVGGPIGP